MAADATTVGTYLKMPMAGLRLYSSSSVDSLGSTGVYWSSTVDSADGAYRLFFGSSSLTTQYESRRAYGESIRCFKDTPETPDDSWTTLYDGSSIATGAGVFYNATDGLISVSGDGATWYTIQDKNLGATTVFNQGDTLTDTNCGYFYQWGNNYGFAHSGTVTTSSTQVDASNYGPGNYYSSSTFITRSESLYDWSSVQNDNLRGGVTGIQVVGHPIKNAYIGGYYEYSYTFKGKTTAEIGNEFNVLVGSIYTNANGVTGANNVECRIKKNIPSLTNAKKIIISGTIVGQNSSATAAEIGIGKGTGWGTGLVGYQVYGSTYNGIKVHLYYNNTDTNGNSVGNATGSTYKPTLTIDLEQKTMTGTMSGFNNSTLSLTDVQVADIRIYEYIICYTSVNSSTISDVSITIEY